MTLDERIEARFAELEDALDELLTLLLRAEQRFWHRMLLRYVDDVHARRLTGVTGVLGCYGGADTFSDLALADELGTARLTRLRTQIFELANGIAADCARLR